MQFKSILLLAIAIASGEVLATPSRVVKAPRKASKTAPAIANPTCTSLISYAFRGYRARYALDYVGSKSQYKKVKNTTHEAPILHDTMIGDFGLCEAAQACADIATIGAGDGERFYHNWNLVHTPGTWTCISSVSGDPFEYTAADNIYLEGQDAAYGYQGESACNSHYSGCEGT